MNGSGNRTGVSESAKTSSAHKQRLRSSKKPRKLPPYNVVLLNDDDHTYDYVIAMLKTLFGFPERKGYELARQVDTGGRAIVLTTTKEHAELKRDQIHAYGPDRLIVSCRGGMSARIEPVR